MSVIDGIEIVGWSASAAVRAAEMAVVGAAMASRAAAEHAAELLRPDDFADGRSALVFEAVMGLLDDDAVIDETAVFGELQRRGTISRIGGGADLYSLVSHAAIGAGSLAYHARIVANDACRRRLCAAGVRVQQLASNPAFDSESDIDLIRKTIDTAASATTEDDPVTAGELLLPVLDELEQPLTNRDLVPPPYLDLEMLLPGFAPGQLAVIAARPSIGKSTVALDCARAAAVRLRLPTLLVTLEMSRTEVMHRLIAAEASVPLNNVRGHQLTSDDWTRIAKAQTRIMDAPLVIDDAVDCGLNHVRAQLRRLARANPTRLVIIDYLGLMRVSHAESRERAIADLARGSKVLAKEFNVPILLLAQLNRSLEHRSDKKPMLSDVRESGAVEADADIVILLHREEFYDKDSPRAGELDLIIAKQRNGPTGTATVAFQGRYARAVDMAPVAGFREVR